jgi:cob(I)alamin adenosyltransferase
LRKGVTDEDYAAARAAWTLAAEALLSGDYDVVICDELNIALHNRLLAEADVVQTLKARPAHVEVIITGRHAPEALWALADYVTEMTLHKHPFTAGRGARKGIEM